MIPAGQPRVLISVHRHDWHHERNPCVPVQETWVAGAAFLDQKVLFGRLFADRMARALEENGEGLNSFFKRLNGHFAVVVVGGNRVIAAVDRVRSLPLFFSLSGGSLSISDDALTLADSTANSDLESECALEFRNAGFVTGSRTLSSAVKQLQAGEAMEFDLSGESVIATQHRYFRFLHREIAIDDAERRNILAEKLRGAIDRLLICSRNRPLLIPLSGGVDSRLIASLIKRAGKREVICFSYGRPGNPESDVSRRIAAHLGFRWEFIPYSPQKWRRWFHSREWQQYVSMSHMLSSLPHIQDWPAVGELAKRIDRVDSIVVPGHTGDFICGGHIPRSIADNDDPNKQQVIGALLQRHFFLGSRTDQHPAVRERLETGIRRALNGFGCQSVAEACSAYEFWEWQERQAKFIVNSVRVYEYWGFDWWLPLWDAEVMDFWSSVPVRLRVGKRLYLDFLENTFRLPLIDEVASKSKPTRNRIHGVLANYFDDPLALTGIVSYPEYLYLAARGIRGVNSILVRRIIASRGDVN